MGEFTMVILLKYGFKDIVKWSGFYLTNYKVYIHLPCINTQKLTTAPLNITHIISSSNHWSTILSQGRPSIVREIITLILFLCFIHLRQFTTVTNQCQQLSQTWTNSFEVLRFLISFWEAPWYSSSLLGDIYLYNPRGIRFHIFGLLPDLHLCYFHPD